MPAATDKGQGANLLLEAALAYAARGWPVFPCSPKHKAPLLGKDRDAAGKDIPGSGGVTKASTDPEQIRAWWKRWPKALVAIATGHPTLDAGGRRLFVLDFDPREDGDTGEVWTLERLKAETEGQIGCTLPPTLAALSPSEGVHAYLLQPDDGEPINNRGNLPEHVDVRGLGGYVIAPPSIMGPSAIKGQAGLRYRWVRNDAAAAIADAPAELMAVLRDRTPRKGSGGRQEGAQRRQAYVASDVPDDVRKYALSALDGECKAVRDAASGKRNEQLNISALKIASLVAAGALDDTIARHSLEAAARDNPGRDSDSQIHATIESGWTAGLNSPRDLEEIAAAALDRQQRRDRHGPSAGGARLSRPGASSAPSSSSAPHPAKAANGQPSFQDGRAAPDASDGGAGGRTWEYDDFAGEGSGPEPEELQMPDRIRVDPDPRADRHCAFLPMTDLGNAERFRARHGHRFRFCKELGWFMWDDRRWALLSEEKDRLPGEVLNAVFHTVRAIRNEAKLIEASGAKENLPPNPTREEEAAALDFIAKWKGKVPVLFSELIEGHAKSSEGSNRLGCIANLAKAFPDIMVRADQLDQDREVINVQNGTLVLVNAGNEVAVRIRRHDPRDLITKVASVEYDPGATCPEYDGFLNDVQPGASEQRFLDQWHGLSMTGNIREQKLAFYHGKGRNGKSTLVDIMGDIAGDYGGSVGIETFLDQGRGRKGGDATPDLARLPGIRFLRTSEPEKGAKLAEALIKLVTGGEEITARHLNKGFFSFLPSFKLTVSGNHKPKITGHDDGIWRRVMLVPWEVQIPEDQVDERLPEKLRAERAGILNRLLAGLVDYKMNGLVKPESVTRATQKYREASDQLGRFLRECTIDKEGVRSKSSLLFNLFTAWAKANSGGEWSTQGFARAMEDRGYERITSNGVHWEDIQMIKTLDDFADDGQQSADYGGGSPEPSDGERRRRRPPISAPGDEDGVPPF
jgi:putative DNA primase/helicase